MAPQSSDMDEFLRLFQTLPQELHDMIHEFTFSSPITSKPIAVDESYTFPSILQVDRASRQKNARAYFAYNTFVIGTEDLLISWLTAVDRKHRRSITDVRFLPFSLQVSPAAALVSKCFLVAAMKRKGIVNPPRIRKERWTTPGGEWVVWAGPWAGPRQ